MIQDTGPKADAFGWIEAELIAAANAWQGIVSTSTLFDVSSELFALLFGVANTSGRNPLFAGRGVPKDVSDAFFAHWSQYPNEFFGETWVTLEELRGVDWLVPIGLDAQPRTIFQRHQSRACWDERIVAPIVESLTIAQRAQLRRGEIVEVPGGYLESRQLLRNDAKLVTHFGLVLELMETLKRHSEGGVRWVVGFTS